MNEYKYYARFESAIGLDWIFPVYAAAPAAVPKLMKEGLLLLLLLPDILDFFVVYYREEFDDFDRSMMPYLMIISGMSSL